MFRSEGINFQFDCNKAGQCTVTEQQINEEIEQINDVVQTNSATSQECAAASQEMSTQAENLNELIRKFKVAHFAHKE